MVGEGADSIDGGPPPSQPRSTGVEASTLLGGWPRAVGRTVDVVALVVALLLGVVLVGDWMVPGRPIVALVFLVSVPGWSALRAFGFPASGQTLFVACGLSIAVTMVVGQVLASAPGWPWRAATIVICGLSAVAVASRAIRAS